MNNYEEIIRILSSDNYYNLRHNVMQLVNDGVFLRKIIEIRNPLVFDRFVKMCEYKIDTNVLYEERNKYIKKSILSLNKDSLCEFFELNSIDKAHDERLANRYLIEYIVGYYFHDNYYNFMTNFYQMINYLRHVKKELVSKFNIDLYNEFVSLRNMSFIDKIGFFRLLLDDMNVMEKFYDDMNIVRTDSHKELVDKSLKLSHESNLYNADISRRLDVDVYVLNGEEFYGFVRCLSLARNNLDVSLEYLFSSKKRLGYSFSYIGDKNIGTSDYTGKSVALFYDNIDHKDIMYVHHGDLHAKKMVEQDDYLSIKENEILTPASLIANTKNYNEIYIKKNVKEMKPKALICYDSITIDDINFAKKYNLSILVINRKKYKRFETHDDDYMDYSYVI